MDWVAISALAQLIGIPVLVVSLIYVARQLAQNTKMMRMNAAAHRLDQDFEIVAPLIQSESFSNIWMKGEAEYDTLSPTEQMRLLFFERRALNSWYHMHQMRMQGILPDASWIQQSWDIRNIGKRQAIRAAWEKFRHSFDEEFQKYMEKEYMIGAEAPVGTTPATKPE